MRCLPPAQRTVTCTCMHALYSLGRRRRAPSPPSLSDIHNPTRTSRDTALPRRYMAVCTSDDKLVVLVHTLLKMQGRVTVVFSSTVDGAHRVARFLQL